MSGFCRIGDLLFRPLRELDPWAGLAAVSLVTALLMLLVYRYASDQEGIRTAKNRIQAHLMEVRLYRDDLRASLRAQGMIVGCNFRYLGYAALPLAVVIVPLLVLILHADMRFRSRPLSPGETAILTLRFPPAARPSQLSLALKADPGIAVDSPVLRIDSEAEADWRVRALAEGIHNLEIRVGGERLLKEIAVGGSRLQPLSHARVRGAWLERAMHPREEPIPEDSVLASIEIRYPARSWSLAGWDIHWMAGYFGMSLLFVLILKRLFRVEI